MNLMVEIQKVCTSSGADGIEFFAIANAKCEKITKFSIKFMAIAVVISVDLTGLASYLYCLITSDETGSIDIDELYHPNDIM